jgi:hypothetical protein
MYPYSPPPEHPDHARRANYDDGEEYTLTPPDTRLYDIVHDHKIVTWRELCFIKKGLELVHARALALRRDIDREEVERLVDEGAPSARIAEILL